MFLGNDPPFFKGHGDSRLHSVADVDPGAPGAKKILILGIPKPNLADHPPLSLSPAPPPPVAHSPRPGSRGPATAAAPGRRLGGKLPPRNPLDLQTSLSCSVTLEKEGNPFWGRPFLVGQPPNKKGKRVPLRQYRIFGGFKLI